MSAHLQIVPAPADEPWAPGDRVRGQVVLDPVPTRTTARVTLALQCRITGVRREQRRRLAAVVIADNLPPSPEPRSFPFDLLIPRDAPTTWSGELSIGWFLIAHARVKLGFDAHAEREIPVVARPHHEDDPPETKLQSRRVHRPLVFRNLGKAAMVAAGVGGAILATTPPGWLALAGTLGALGAGSAVLNLEGRRDRERDRLIRPTRLWRSPGPHFPDSEVALELWLRPRSATAVRRVEFKLVRVEVVSWKEEGRARTDPRETEVTRAGLARPSRDARGGADGGPYRGGVDRWAQRIPEPLPPDAVAYGVALPIPADAPASFGFGDSPESAALWWRIDVIVEVDGHAPWTVRDELDVSNPVDAP